MTKKICPLCQTPTYYDRFEKLQQHRRRCHDAFFNQTERGTKRKNIMMNMKRKKIKTENDMIGKGGKDTD